MDENVTIEISVELDGQDLRYINAACGGDPSTPCSELQAKRFLQQKGVLEALNDIRIKAAADEQARRDKRAARKRHLNAELAAKAAQVAARGEIPFELVTNPIADR